VLNNNQNQDKTMKIKTALILCSYTTASEHGLSLEWVGKDACVVADYRPYLDRQPGKTTWKNGKPVHYERAVCDNHIRSFAVLKRGRMTFFFGPARLERPAPKGYRWDIDADGLRLVRRADGADYHPGATYLLAPNWAAKITGRLAELAEKRLAEIKQQRESAKSNRLAERLEKRGAFRVGLADSLAVGNCAHGTESWANRHGFSSGRWHDPRKLLAADPSNARLRLAVRFAALRHARLTEHGAQVCYPR